jgi:hypothetical protein
MHLVKRHTLVFFASSNNVNSNTAPLCNSGPGSGFAQPEETDRSGRLLAAAREPAAIITAADYDLETDSWDYFPGMRTKVPLASKKRSQASINLLPRKVVMQALTCFQEKKSCMH